MDDLFFDLYIKTWHDFHYLTRKQSQNYCKIHEIFGFSQSLAAAASYRERELSLAWKNISVTIVAKSTTISSESFLDLPSYFLTLPSLKKIGNTPPLPTSRDIYYIFRNENLQNFKMFEDYNTSTWWWISCRRGSGRRDAFLLEFCVVSTDFSPNFKLKFIA